MALVFKDRVKQVTDTTGGTGALTFASTPDGFQSFTAAGLDTTYDTFYYLAESQTIAGEWEVGVGSSDGSVLTRTTVLSSSDSGSLVDFTAGEAIEVSAVLPADGVTGADNTSGTPTNVLPEISSISRSSNSATITFSSSHGLSAGPLANLTVVGCTPTSFNASGGVSPEVIDSTTIQYFNFGPDESASVVGTAFVVGATGFAFGGDNTASGAYSSAFGYRNTATNNAASAFGYNNTASGYRSSAFGYSNDASGYKSSAFGYSNDASGDRSSAFGYNNTTSGYYSAAVGYGNSASGYYSSAFGYSNTATDNAASAFGRYNTASNYGSVAMGLQNTSSAIYGVSVGYNNTASGDYSSAFGYRTSAQGSFSSVFGVRTKSTIANTTEIGYWDTGTVRSSAVRIHGTGYAAISMQNTATALTDGGATLGSEADGTLMREAYSIRRNGSEIIIDINVGGTIQSLSLGTAT